jgi:hypothetical protein
VKGGNPGRMRRTTVATKALAKNTAENGAARGRGESMLFASLTRTKGDRIAAGSIVHRREGESHRLGCDQVLFVDRRSLGVPLR